MDQPPPERSPEAVPTSEQQRSARPRIYVASLSDYNDGRLHGVWVDAAEDLDIINEVVEDMLRRSPTGRAEEFGIHDYEGFGAYQVDDYAPLDLINRVARGVAEHGGAFAAWADYCSSDDEALGRFEEVYLGDWSSAEEYAEQLIDDLGLMDRVHQHVPESLQRFVQFDFASFAQDLELGGDIVVVRHADGVWIFEGDR